jgi:hypothetical protein
VFFRRQGDEDKRQAVPAVLPPGLRRQRDRPNPLLVVVCGLDKPSAKQALGLHEFQGLGPSSHAEILCHTWQAERSVNPFELMV